MKLFEITKAKFIDTGECLSFFKKAIGKVEVHEIDDDTWEAPFFEQYDFEEISVSISGRISETGYIVDNGNDLSAYFKRTGITIYDFELNVYFSGELVIDAEINGQAKGEIENELINSL